jgi:hypothetical protein
VNPQRCGSKVDTIQGAHLGGSERYASTIKGSQASIGREEKKAFDYHSPRSSKI